MVKIGVGSFKKKNRVDEIDETCRAVVKRFKEKRTKVLKQSLSKLKNMPDAERCLRQAVLIRNTFIRAKDLSPKQFERQLLTQPIQCVDDMDTTIIDKTRTTVIDFSTDECTSTSPGVQIPRNDQQLSDECKDSSSANTTKDLNNIITDHNHQLVAPISQLVAPVS